MFTRENLDTMGLILLWRRLGSEQYLLPPPPWGSNSSSPCSWDPAIAAVSLPLQGPQYWVCLQTRPRCIPTATAAYQAPSSLTQTSAVAPTFLPLWSLPLPSCSLPPPPHTDGAPWAHLTLAHPHWPSSLTTAFSSHAGFPGGCHWPTWALLHLGSASMDAFWI